MTAALPCGRASSRRMSDLLLLLLLLVAPWQAAAAPRALNFTREDFPGDFVFGAGTSAYQYEGATAEDGRSPSIWDTFTHAGRMPDKSTGDLASDGYHKYKEDVQLMSDTGLEAYRFSVSWSRLIPRGRGPVNPKGLEYYNNLINGLVKRGIQIHVTLYHLDFPQILEDEYHGWLSPRVVEDFTAFADVCFREFGDRVTHWTTMGEPNVLSIAAYDSGAFPPCRCSAPFGFNCTVGNSTVEPYIVAHNSILAHASVVKLYREKYQSRRPHCCPPSSATAALGRNIVHSRGQPLLCASPRSRRRQATALAPIGTGTFTPDSGVSGSHPLHLAVSTAAMPGSNPLRPSSDRALPRPDLASSGPDPASMRPLALLAPRSGHPNVASAACSWIRPP